LFFNPKAYQHQIHTSALEFVGHITFLISSTLKLPMLNSSHILPSAEGGERTNGVRKRGVKR
jgi:hypothetical protein